MSASGDRSLDDGQAEDRQPIVVAYRLRRIEETLEKLVESSVRPDVYNLNRNADADRFSRIEKAQATEEEARKAAEIREGELRRKADEAKRTLFLAIALAIASPIVSVMVNVFASQIGAAG